ncbi:MAG: signal peptidase II [bacterium]|nr:signal peptidase II [bacterium]
MRPTPVPTVPARSRRYWSAVGLTFGVIGIDQISKWLIQRCCERLVIINPAVAFSLPVPLWGVLVAFIVLLGVLVFAWRSWPETKPISRAWATGLLAGGALSNLIDRFVFGGVRDFIDLRVWPMFNLADLALSLGVILLLWYAFRPSRTSHATQGDQPRPRGTH